MNLLDHMYGTCHSHIANHGIIEHIMDTIDIQRGTFVEFGAWDGVTNCNCLQLIMGGWSGIFIESDCEKFAKLKENYKEELNIHTINDKVTVENNLDKIVFKNHLGLLDFDFCSIDIDGLDLEVFEAFDQFLPTVVCIEGGQMLEPHHGKVPREIAAKNIQQSLSVMNGVFEEKGYKLLCAYQDAFFVKKEYYGKFDVSSDLKELYLDGLQALPHRLPYIQKQLKKVGIKNLIVNFILKRANYKKYGWDNRKKWAVKELPEIEKAIRELR